MRRCLLVIAVCALGGIARADGIDIGAWVMQLPTWWGPGALLGFVVVSLLVDYALNFLVIGWLARRWSGQAGGKVARDLVAYTLWAQVADRVGAVLALLVVAASDSLLDKSSEVYFFTPLFLAKFVLSALAIGVLVWRFARKRWALSRPRSFLLGVAGGILTNPEWGMLAASWVLEARR